MNNEKKLESKIFKIGEKVKIASTSKCRYLIDKEAYIYNYIGKNDKRYRLKLADGQLLLSRFKEEDLISLE